MFKIFVGNLDYKVRPEQVRELFTLYAPIEDLVIPVDPKTSKSKGFAIVMIRDPDLGAAAVRGVNGKRLMGRTLVVNEALKKKKKAEEPAVPPPRTGPFGPRLHRAGEARFGGPRNPRRGGPSSRSAFGPASTPSASASLERTPAVSPPRPVAPGPTSVSPVREVPPTVVPTPVRAAGPAASPAVRAVPATPEEPPRTATQAELPAARPKAKPKGSGGSIPAT